MLNDYVVLISSTVCATMLTMLMFLYLRDKCARRRIAPNLDEFNDASLPEVMSAPLPYDQTRGRIVWVPHNRVDELANR